MVTDCQTRDLREMQEPQKIAVAAPVVESVESQLRNIS
jgi:hypothetical protein